MSYTKRYGFTFNLGNYQSEHIAIEREFSNAVPPDQAILMLAAEVERDHQILEQRRKNGGKP
ncbi:MAG: hypothetical protein PHU23_03185 [Dehalococcoidales bacterium]|nr:hypothetical protein [Dehalococcoidales bacterium]